MSVVMQCVGTVEFLAEFSNANSRLCHVGKVWKWWKIEMNPNCHGWQGNVWSWTGKWECRARQGWVWCSYVGQGIWDAKPIARLVFERRCWFVVFAVAGNVGLLASYSMMNNWWTRLLLVGQAEFWLFGILFFDRDCNMPKSVPLNECCYVVVECG